MLFDETVIDSVDNIGVPLSSLELKAIDLPLCLLNLLILICGQLSHILGVVRSFVSLNNNYPHLLLDHPREEGSLNSQKDVVASDDLGVDAAFSESFDGLHCVLLQLVVEGHHSEEGIIPEELFSITLQV